MFQSSLFNFIVLATSLATIVQGAPIQYTKRIAQTIADSTADWEQACLTAGGGEQCNPVSVTAFTTLLAAAGPCDQQNSGDAMINLAKTLNNDADMIKFTQIFVQQPRNTPSSQAVPYCQQAPQNAELNGLYQCQFQGADLTTFVGGIAVGGNGTIPFGLSAPLSPAGSCPANPSGPVPAGQQLVDITQNPGVASTTTGSNTTTATTSSAAAPVVTTPSAIEPTSAMTTSAAAAAATSSAAEPISVTTTSAAAASSSADFQLQNGKDAQALNAQFATLTTSSSCTAGENACVNGEFAQCVSGTFTVTPCASGLTCYALPLVNSAGTSITCDTTADAESRIVATGATGGITGDGSTSTSSSTTMSAEAAVATTATASSSTTTSSSSGSGFQLQNGKDAQALNAKFATLTASSSCTTGENACVGGAFAQCVNGSFETTACASGLTCAALPLVNSAGTSITCDTTSDAEARIAATGATGGLTGNGN